MGGSPSPPQKVDYPGPPPSPQDSSSQAAEARKRKALATNFGYQATILSDPSLRSPTPPGSPTAPVGGTSSYHGNRGRNNKGGDNR